MQWLVEMVGGEYLPLYHDGYLFALGLTCIGAAVSLAAWMYHRITTGRWI